MKTRCGTCFGSGQIMGGGMINFLDCPQCDGTGKPEQVKPVEIDYVKARETRQYKSATKRLVKQGLTLAQAQESLDKELHQYKDMQ